MYTFIVGRCLNSALSLEASGGATEAGWENAFVRSVEFTDARNRKTQTTEVDATDAGLSDGAMRSACLADARKWSFLSSNEYAQTIRNQIDFRSS